MTEAASNLFTESGSHDGSAFCGWHHGVSIRRSLRFAGSAI
jgi:hypothetical protein